MSPITSLPSGPSGHLKWNRPAHVRAPERSGSARPGRLLRPGHGCRVLLLPAHPLARGLHGGGTRSAGLGHGDVDSRDLREQHQFPGASRKRLRFELERLRVQPIAPACGVGRSALGRSVLPGEHRNLRLQPLGASLRHLGAPLRKLVLLVDPARTHRNRNVPDGAADRGATRLGHPLDHRGDRSLCDALLFRRRDRRGDLERRHPDDRAQRRGADLPAADAPRAARGAGPALRRRGRSGEVQPRQLRRQPRRADLLGGPCSSGS